MNNESYQIKTFCLAKLKNSKRLASINFLTKVKSNTFRFETHISKVIFKNNGREN